MVQNHPLMGEGDDSMGIGSITSTNRMSVTQTMPTDVKDQKSKSIQNKISDVEQQIRKLSSEEDLSVNEKEHEKKKLKKEESDLNTKLKQHQEELLRTQKREIMLAEMLEEQEPAKEDDTEDKTQSIETSSDTVDPKNLPADVQQTAQPGTVITQNSDGTVILKEVMAPDRNLDSDTESRPVDAVKEEAIAEEETKNTEEEETRDTNRPGEDMQAMVSSDSSLQQASRQGTVIAKIKDGIAILKGEIKQDENRGIDTERKQAELEKMKQQQQRATAFQFAVLGEADDAMKSAAETIGDAKNKADTENTLYISGLSTPQEEQASQQRFYVSFG